MGTEPGNRGARRAHITRWHISHLRAWIRRPYGHDSQRHIAWENASLAISVFVIADLQYFSRQSKTVTSTEAARMGIVPCMACGKFTTVQVMQMCLDCGATKTPLWRWDPSYEYGVRRLCNRCGCRAARLVRKQSGLHRRSARQALTDTHPTMRHCLQTRIPD